MSRYEGVNVNVIMQLSRKLNRDLKNYWANWNLGDHCRKREQRISTLRFTKLLDPQIAASVPKDPQSVREIRRETVRSDPMPRSCLQLRFNDVRKFLGKAYIRVRSFWTIFTIE